MANTNNRIPSNKKHRLPLYRRAWFLTLMVLILIAVIVGAIIFIVKPSNQRSSESAQDSSTPPAQKITASSKDNSDNDPEPETNPDQVIVQYEGENPNRLPELSGSITYSDYSGGVLAVGTSIDQYLSDGTCELRATGPTGQVYAATSDIVPAASTSACRELSVAVPNGAYALEITLISNEKQGIIKQEAGPWD